jgi:hypothetical protein
LRPAKFSYWLLEQRLNPTSPLSRLAAATIPYTAPSKSMSLRARFDYRTLQGSTSALHRLADLNQNASTFWRPTSLRRMHVFPRMHRTVSVILDRADVLVMETACVRSPEFLHEYKFLLSGVYSRPFDALDAGLSHGEACPGA